MATNGTTPRAGAGALAGSAGLTPQMSIVNADLTPTVFFFRWLLNSRGAAQQTPWVSDIDAAGFNLDNLGNLTLTGSITFPDGTTQTTAPAALVPATHTVLGGVKIGANISVTADGTISVAAPGSGGGGTVIGVTASAPLASSGGAAPNITITSPLPVANGGSGSAAPSLIAGANVTITGAWPNQTIAATGGSGGGQNQTPWLSNIDAAGWQLQNVSTVAGNGNIVLAAGGAGGLQLNTNSLVRMYINSSGNVGIGTTTPQLKLHVLGGTGGQIAVRVENTGTASTDAASLILQAGPADASWTVGTNAAVGAASNLSFYNNGTGGARLVIQATGNIGIGTSAPGYKLDVAGDVNVSGVFRVNGTPISAGGFQTPWLQNINAAGFSLANVSNIGVIGPVGQMLVATAATGTPTAQFYVGASGTAPTLYFGDANPPSHSVSIGMGVPAGAVQSDFTIGTWSSAGGGWIERVRVTNGGNVGIGTVPSVPLDVVGAGPQVSIRPAGGATQTTWSAAANAASASVLVIAANNSISIGSGIPGGAATDGIVFSTLVGGSWAERFRITNSGLVGIGMGNPGYLLSLPIDSAGKPGTSTWTIASDARLKRDIRPLTGGLDVIRKLRPVEAEYNGLDGTPNGARVVSFLADEVRRVLPYSVTSHRGRLGAARADILDLNIHEILMHAILAIQQLAEAA